MASAVKRLTDQERIALREVGPPDEGPIAQATFDELERLGWGRWGPDYWEVTAEGRRALELDDLARAKA